MKGMLVFIALVLAGSIYVLGSFGKVADPILQHICAQEGSVDSVQDAAQDDGFTAKYKPFLDQRYWLGTVALLLDENTFLKVAQDTWNRYNDTPLEYDPEFGYLIFHEADLLNQRQQFASAAAMYEAYMQLFPDGKSFTTARSALGNLRVYHGIQ
jgi:hypothetical protein